MVDSPVASATPTPSPATQTVARVLGVGHRWGSLQALREIDWSLSAGRLTALVGANGAGKSTLLSVLSGRLRPTQGDLQLFGQRSKLPAVELRRRVSFTTQRPALDPEMTGRELLRLFALLDGRRSAGSGLPSETESLVAALGLKDHLDRTVRTYSGGLRQRLHLVIDAVRQAKLQLWDEPASALDPRGRRHLWQHFVEAARSGAAIVVASHDLAAVERHADEVLLLHRGSLLKAGEPRALVDEHGLETLTFELSSPPPKNAPAPDIPGVETFDWSRNTLQVATREASALEGTVTQWLQGLGLAVTEVRRRSPDLASVYFHLSSESLDSPAGKARR